MRKRIRQVVNHPLVSGSFVLFSGGLFANFFNFLFNILMIRILPVAEYGILASFISLILIFGYASDSLTPTIVHFSGSHFVKKEYSIIHGLFIQFSKILFVLGVLICLGIVIFSSTIAGFLHINDIKLVFLLGIIVLLSFISVVNKSLLQAQLKFRIMSIASIANAILKLIVGVGLVIMGWQVSGALFAFVASFSLYNIIMFFPLRKIIFTYKSKKKHRVISYKSLFQYGVPSSITIILLACYITTDVILVKHFFNPTQAGLYAGLSLLGRIIFFFTAPIVAVMFPLITHRHAKKENYKSIFWLSLFVVLFLSFAITMFYFIFPAFTIKFFLKKDEYLKLIPYVGLFGLFGTTYALLVAITNFYLAIKKIYVFIPILIGVILQAVLIIMFHENFLQVVLISSIDMIILFISLLVYYWKRYAHVY